MSRIELPLGSRYIGDRSLISSCKDLEHCNKANPSCPGYILGRCRFYGENRVDEEFATLFSGEQEIMVSTFIREFS